VFRPAPSIDLSNSLAGRKVFFYKDGHHQWQNGDDFLLTLCPEIPLDEDEAAQALIDIIQEHGDWVEVN
jgi:hypothetical protein